jgi:nucleoside-diphosphate-sugar epimerase
MKLLVTGANGFIGKALCEKMATAGWTVIGAVRSIQHCANLPAGVDIVEVGDINGHTEWRRFLIGIHTVIHLAGRVHVMDESELDPQTQFRCVNVDGTAHLASTSADNGVRRFIYLSSIKVNGEGKSTAYTEDDQPSPLDAYAFSKWEAEQALWDIADGTKMEVVVLRPPLVYGPGVKANFLSLLKIVHSGIPLPLANAHNRRSLMYLGNLIGAVVVCISHPNAAGQTFLLSDGDDPSMRELVQRIAVVLGRPARLMALSPKLVRMASTLIGKQAAAERFFGSLTVDSTRIRRRLEWKIPFNMHQGLTDTARWFLEEIKKHK